MLLLRPLLMLFNYWKQLQRYCIYSLQQKKLEMNPNEPDCNILLLQKGVIMWSRTLNELKIQNTSTNRISFLKASSSAGVENVRVLFLISRVVTERLSQLNTQQKKW